MGKKIPGNCDNSSGRESNQQQRIRIKKMLATGDVLGKFSSLKSAENELSRLGYTKTKAGWMGKQAGAQITYLPATKRYQVTKVAPA